MRESRIESQITRYAKSCGCLCYKWSSPSQRGVTDRIIIGPTGKVVFLEIKAPGKRPEPLQIHEMNKINAHGACAVWVDNSMDAKRVIDEIRT